MTRRGLGLAVLGVWLAVVGWHVKREYFVPEATRLAMGARSLAPGAHWFVIRLDGATIGVAQSALDTLPDGFRFRDEITLDVPAMGRLHRSYARTDIELGAVLELRTFRFALDSEIGRFAVEGVAYGDTAVSVVMDAGGGAQPSFLRTDQGLLLDAVLPLRMAASGALRVGNEFTTRVFDPSSMAEREVSVHVVARETLVVPDSAALVDGRWVATVLDTVPVWRVDQKFGGVSVSSWVDDDGQIVRAESPLGFTIERLYYDLAQQEWRTGRDRRDLAAGYGALIEGTAIASNVDLGDVLLRDSLAVRLRGVELDGFDLAGDRQALRGDVLTVMRQRSPADAGYTLPYRGGGAPGEELEATALVQSTDPRIIDTARRIVGDETDPVVVARLLNAWVYRELAKEITLSVPSAVQVLEAGQGDCNEHTVLYLALARAVGLPARTAVGLVHIRGSFYYHAWPEVWLGEWVAVDPTLGQYPADASHLRFLTGGLARQVELVRLIGRLQLEVL
ncbi:MAG TPA: transglutaminase-like domain-containing protein [Longimicrobiales bacterium]|nr:transglutaminase-like domain-containing protein [Longimicrobiales bacterium]